MINTLIFIKQLLYLLFKTALDYYVIIIYLSIHDTVTKNIENIY